jgi:steroid 5-alpha reductase family enzyme
MSVLAIARELVDESGMIINRMGTHSRLVAVALYTHPTRMKDKGFELQRCVVLWAIRPTCNIARHNTEDHNPNKYRFECVQDGARMIFFNFFFTTDITPVT